jgi:hypothetical protein
MNTENVTEVNVESLQNYYGNLKWKETQASIERKPHLRIFQLGDEPEICYIFKSGYGNPQIFHVIFEDGYESPIIINFWTAREIKEHLSIDI